MKLVTSETFRNLKLRSYKKLSSSTRFQQLKQYTTLAATNDLEQGVLAPKRVNQVELFKKYTYQVLPALEQSVEVDLLNKMFATVPAEVRSSIAQSYLRKFVEQQAITPAQESIKAQPENVTSARPREKVNIYLNSLADVKMTQIGKLFTCTFDEFKKQFKHKSPGDFLENHIQFTRNFSVQITDEAFRTMDMINRSQRNPLILEQIKNPENVINHPDEYTALFSFLKGEFQQEILKYRNNVLFERLFSTSIIFDSIIAILIAELPKIFTPLKQNQTRQQFFEQLTKELLEKIDHEQPNSTMPALFCQTIKPLVIGDFTLDLQKYEQNPMPVPSDMKEFGFKNHVGYSSNLLFYGDHGTGKSGLLTAAIIFAQQKGYITVVVPSGFDWTQKENNLVRHHETGLSMQPDAAVKFLEQFKSSNEALLKKFTINQSLYGKYNLSGVHDDGTEAVPNIYDPVRKYHFKDYEQFLIEEEIEHINEQNQIMSVRLNTKITPKTLLELVDYGINNSFYATCVIYEVLEQLYNQDQFKVLVAVDGLNWFYRPSIFPSFRYESNKQLRGFIPPYHMSLPRAFMHLDGHKIKNGYKIAASTIYRLHQHDFQPQHIYIDNSYGVKLNGLPLDHFRVFLEYCIQTGYWKADNFAYNTQESFWMETQGNLAAAIKCIKEHWRDI